MRHPFEDFGNVNMLSLKMCRKLILQGFDPREGNNFQVKLRLF